MYDAVVQQIAHRLLRQDLQGVSRVRTFSNARLGLLVLDHGSKNAYLGIFDGTFGRKRR